MFLFIDILLFFILVNVIFMVFLNNLGLNIFFVEFFFVYLNVSMDDFFCVDDNVIFYDLIFVLSFGFEKSFGFMEILILMIYF